MAAMASKERSQKIFEKLKTKTANKVGSPLPTLHHKLIFNGF